MKREISPKQSRINSRLKTERRATYNEKYNKSRSRFKDKSKIPSWLSDPRDIPLDQCILFVRYGPGGSTDIHFKEDATEKELNRVIEIFEEEM